MTKINLGDIFEEDKPQRQETKKEADIPQTDIPQKITEKTPESKLKRKYVKKQLTKGNSTMSDIKKEIISSYNPANSIKSIEKEDSYAQNLLSEVTADLQEESKQKIKKLKKIASKPYKSKKKMPKKELEDIIYDTGNIYLFESSIWKFKRCPTCESKLKKSKVVRINNNLFQKIKCKNKKCKFEMNYKFDIE